MTKFVVSLVIFLFLAATPAMAQKSCCGGTTHTMAFAQLGSDDGFRAAHLEPPAFHYQSQSGAMITFPTPDGKKAQGYEVKAAKGSDAVILMIHEWWGLNDYIKREADKLQKALGGKATVIALDLYDGQVAAKREEAAKLMADAKEERIRAIISGALQYVPKNAKIGSVGWCFGGGWSLQTALMGAERAKACVMYYGMPESDSAKLVKLSAPVLGIFADKDGWINPEAVKKFSEAMKSTGKDLTLKTYDADHAFANPSNPKYDKQSTEDAYQHTVKFFEEKLLK